MELIKNNINPSMLQKDLPFSQKQFHQFLGKKRWSEDSNLKETKQNMGNTTENTSITSITSITSNKDLLSGQTENKTFDLSFNLLPAFHESPFGESLFTTQNQQNFQLEIEDNEFQSFWDLRLKMEDDSCQLIDFPFISNEYATCLKEVNLSQISNHKNRDSLEKPFSIVSNKSGTKFLVIPKGKKKVSKAKKINKALPPQFKCNHCNCGTSFYTPFQQITHHHKMTPLCTNDTITLLKLLSKAKNLLLSSSSNQTMDLSRLDSIKEKYTKIGKSVSLENHFQYILGSRFEECVTDDDDDDDNNDNNDDE